MARFRPGWLVVLCAFVLLVSAWLPWLTTGADGGGRANAIGGRVGRITYPPDGFGVGQLYVILASTLLVAAAMSARRLFPRLSSSAALLLCALLAATAGWYYRLYVVAPISAGHGFYVGVATIAVASVLSVLAMIVAWSDSSAVAVGGSGLIGTRD